MSHFKEEKVQSECVVWFWNTFPKLRGCFFSIKNNSANAIQGSRDKSLGMVSGVADTCLIYNGLATFIEFKTEEGVQSSAQREWEKLIEFQRVSYVIIRSQEEFKDLIYSIII